MEEIRARRPAGLVGTVSHRPFLGCPVPESFVPCGLPGGVGMARGTRALPGGGSGLGPLVEIRARGGGWFACKARFGRVLLRSTRGGLVVGLAPWGGSWVVASRFLGWSAILRADEVEARWEGS